MRAAYDIATFPQFFRNFQQLFAIFPQFFRNFSQLDSTPQDCNSPPPLHWVRCALLGVNVCFRCPVFVSGCALSVSVGFVHAVCVTGCVARALGVNVCFCGDVCVRISLRRAS